MAPLGRRVEGRVAKAVLRADRQGVGLVLAVVEQGLDAGHASDDGRQMERRVALNVRQIHVGVEVDQQQQGVLVAVEGRVHQGRLALAVLKVDEVAVLPVAAIGQQGIQDKRVSSQGSQVDG